MANANKNAVESGENRASEALPSFCSENNWLDDLRAFGDALAQCQIFSIFGSIVFSAAGASPMELSILLERLRSSFLGFWCAESGTSIVKNGRNLP
jgi:hypothetical protein